MTLSTSCILAFLQPCPQLREFSLSSRFQIVVPSNRCGKKSYGELANSPSILNIENLKPKTAAKPYIFLGSIRVNLRNLRIVFRGSKSLRVFAAPASAQPKRREFPYTQFGQLLMQGQAITLMQQSRGFHQTTSSYCVNARRCLSPQLLAKLRKNSSTQAM